MELAANTGQADRSSVWGSGLLSTITGLGDTAARIIGSVRGTGQTAAQTPAPVVGRATVGGTPSWLPWAIGGGLLLVVAVLFMRK
jgi:hypothetical protein